MTRSLNLIYALVLTIPVASGCRTFSGSDLSNTSVSKMNWAACDRTEKSAEENQLKERMRIEARLALLGAQSQALLTTTVAVRAATGPKGLGSEEVGVRFFKLTDQGELVLEEGKTIKEALRYGANVEANELRTSGEGFSQERVEAVELAVAEVMAEVSSTVNGRIAQGNLSGEEAQTLLASAKYQYRQIAEHALTEGIVAGEAGNIKGAGRLTGAAATVAAEAARILPTESLNAPSETIIGEAVQEFNKLVGSASSGENAATTNVNAVESGRLALARGVARAAVTYAAKNHSAAPQLASAVESLYGSSKGAAGVILSMEASLEAAADRAAREGLGQRAVVSNINFEAVATGSNTGGLGAITQATSFSSQRVAELAVSMKASGFAAENAGVTLNFGQASQRVQQMWTERMAALPPQVQEVLRNNESMIRMSNVETEARLLPRGMAARPAAIR